MDTAVRVNSMGIDTPHGYRSFSIYHGDISVSQVSESRAMAWITSLNEVLGCMSVDSAHDIVVLTLKQEVLRQVDLAHAGGASRLRIALEALRNALQANSVILRQVAVAARVVAEHLVQALSQQFKTTWGGILDKDIEGLRASGQLAPWLTSYLHSLRILGNQVSFTYDLMDHPLSRTERNGDVTRFGYDNLHRLRSEVRTAALGSPNRS